ncbi:Unknown protein sequence [Pseudomonas amygdali pv. morsprunorum]|nr:Unknown protein sequence [Pseudomonas amygdali pv. morsprunorum]
MQTLKARRLIGLLNGMTRATSRRYRLCKLMETFVKPCSICAADIDKL